jgi:hypothetical protein
MPFVVNDIVRSKRWIPSGSTIAHQWDFLGGVTSVATVDGYNIVRITTSNTGYNPPVAYTNYYLGSADSTKTVKQFVDTISVL